MMKYCPECSAELNIKTMDGIDRLACSFDFCNFVHWNNPVPVVAAIVEYENNILLARNASWAEGMFGLITGFLEQGESPEDGIVREISEEINLASESPTFVGNYSFFKMNQIILAYHVKTSGEIKLNEEIAEYKLVSASDLQPWGFGTGLAVADWLEKFHKNGN